VPSAKTVTFVADPDTLDALDTLVDRDGSNRSEVIRSLIRGAGHPGGHIWVAYYTDFSAVVPFGDETHALRHAVRHNMEVLQLPFGMSIQAADQERFDQARKAG
jgi:hypothetical protein